MGHNGVIQHYAYFKKAYKKNDRQKVCEIALDTYNGCISD